MSTAGVGGRGAIPIGPLTRQGGAGSGGTTFGPGSGPYPGYSRHPAGVGGPRGVSRGVQTEKPAAQPPNFQFFQPGGAGAGAGTGVAPVKPGAPQLERAREIGPGVPELERMGQGYEAQLRNLEAGTGHSMDVMLGAQTDNAEAQIDQMRQAAAQQGIPFDEQAARAQLQRGVNSAMAQEKLGREKLTLDAYGQAPGIIGANEQARQGRWQIGSGNDNERNRALNEQYGTQANMYGEELSAANSANNALLSFMSNLMGSALRGPSTSMSSYFG
jgi:hypothetical protein